MEQTTYTTKDNTTVIVLTPTGRLDITTAWQFRLKLQECISKLSPHVVVNLGQVNFIDSSGLTSLVAGMRDADKESGSFRLCNVHPEAKLVFEVTMMDSVFDIYETEVEALENSRATDGKGENSRATDGKGESNRATDGKGAAAERSGANS